MLTDFGMREAPYHAPSRTAGPVSRAPELRSRRLRERRDEGLDRGEMEVRVGVVKTL